MNAATIVAYTYKAQTLCPGCTYKAVGIPPVATTDVGDVETMLDRIAYDRGIDRQDEYSFDSGDFPKVVFADQIQYYERFEDAACMGCGEGLI